MHRPVALLVLRFALIVGLLLGVARVPVARAQEPSPALPAPPPLRDARFGAVEAYVAPEVATAAGVGWTRITFWWHELQRAGPDDWNPFFFPDGLLNQELSAGRELVGILGATPAWALAPGGTGKVPAGLYLPYDDPGNYWGQFVFKIARRYQGQIDRWIVWNEPDVWDPNHPGHTWDGSVQDYVQLLKIARRAARAANPNARIHLAATTYWWDAEYGREQYFKKLLDAIVADPEAATEDGFFDVATIHVYFTPQQVWDVTHYFRAELDRHGLGHKPLWINETNAPPSTDPAHPAPTARFPVTLAEQANFLAQGWALALAAGAERVSLYKTRDETGLPAGIEPYGLMRTDGSVRPFFWTYRTLVTYLGQFTSARLTTEGAIRRVVVQRGSLGQTTVVWNSGSAAAEVTVPAAGSQALLVDQYGPLRVITPRAGLYHLSLPPTQGRIGATTLMVVEGAGADLSIPRPPESALPVTPPTPGTPAERAGCLFYSETAGGRGGYSVCDDASARFRTALQQWGLQNVGYPISRRYVRDGFVTQAFQKAIMQWRPESGTVVLANVFDDLHQAGHDASLLASYQTPLQLPAGWDGELSWTEVVRRRQGLLDARPALRRAYFAAGEPLTFFGLPTSEVQDMGSHYAVRLQRAVLQEWKETVPWANAGEVTIANGGDIAKALGLLPPDALTPETP